MHPIDEIIDTWGMHYHDHLYLSTFVVNHKPDLVHHANVLAEPPSAMSLLVTIFLLAFLTELITWVGQFVLLDLVRVDRHHRLIRNL